MGNLKYGIVCLMVLSAVSLISCDRPECTNKNPVFDRFAPSTAEYKRELSKEMKKIGQENLSYWFDRYEKTDTGEYIFVHAQGKELCAMAHIRIDASDDKLAGLRRKEGLGYSGAELSGLRIHLAEKNLGEVTFVYGGLNRIID